MARIEWSDEYALGLPAIDKDHRELVDQCNEYLEAVDQGASLQSLAEILGRMILRTQAHFLSEERMLDRHAYPGLAQHKADHDQLLIQAQALKDRFDQADDDEDLARTVIAETSDFMRSWLLDHICFKDRPYRPYLRSLS